MANVYDRLITQDGPRNAGVRITGILDTSDATLIPILGLDELQTNDPRMVPTGLRIDKVQYSFSEQLQGVLEWSGLNPQTALAMSGQGEFCTNHVGGLIPNMSISGYEGDVNFRTQNYPPGTNAVFSIVVDFVKLYS